MQQKIKEKTCQDEDCNNTFFQYKSTDKYCSYSCQAKNTNTLKKTEIKRKPLRLSQKSIEKMKAKAKLPLKKTEIKRKPLRLSQKSIEKMKAKAKLPKKKTEFQLEFEKQAQKIKEAIIKHSGELVCDKCGTNYSIQFSTHHIIFRSERPKHHELNNFKNLIHLCFDCHESFHKNKKSRNYLVKSRELTDLFGNIWGYDEDEN
jgi:hypothetical protein